MRYGHASTTHPQNSDWIVVYGGGKGKDDMNSSLVILDTLE